MKPLVRLGTVALLALVFGALVPQGSQAVVVNLTSAGASGSIGDAFFLQVPDQSTGTGVIDPFVRMQASGTERGFNTDYRPLTGDLANVNSSGQFTHSVRVNEFGVVDRGGIASYRFLLDINQTSANPYLSLDELKIYVADAPNLSSLAQLGFVGTKLYDMDAAGDSWVWLDYSLNAGSGSGDMFTYLPATLFSGYETKYLYLYSKFGVNYASNDGFEEWARVDGEPLPPPPAVPEPATLFLLGGGLAGAAALRRRRRA